MDRLITENVVYHYTDTARLPFILDKGALLPGRNRIADFPDPDFLWATTSPVGDRTASASVEACRAGLVRLVRFVLPTDAFEPWRDIVRRFPIWTPLHVALLEEFAAGKSSPENWKCRVEPLPSNCWLGIETRSYTDNAWRPLSKPWRVMRIERCTMGTQIGEKIYISTMCEGPDGLAGFKPAVVATERAA